MINKMNVLIALLINLLYVISFDVENNSTLLPMWSKGFATTCCDVYPSHIGQVGR